MKKILRNLCSLAVILAMTLSLNTVALAQGTTSIGVNNSTIGIGDSTTVSVTASSNGVVTVKYTASLMDLESCSASGYTSNGNTITFSGTNAELVFVSKGEGTASIIVSSSTCSGCSTTISISGDATEVVTAEPVDTQTVSEPETPTSAASVGVLNENGGFDYNGVSYVVSERFTEEEIPAGFSKVSLKIANGTYNELTNGVITIIYLKPADNTAGSGVFYLYDAEAGTVAPFEMIGTAGNYVVLSTPDSVPSVLVSSMLTVSNGTFDVYSIDGSEFYYLYGTNNSGVTGWFMYDSVNGAIGRADLVVLSSSSSISDESSTSDIGSSIETSSYDATKVYKDKLSKLRKIISFLIVVCVLLVFALVNILIRKKTNNEGEEEPDDIFAKEPVKTSLKSPRSIVFKDTEKKEDEEDEEKENGVAGPEKVNNSGLNMMDLNDL